MIACALAGGLGCNSILGIGDLHAGSTATDAPAGTTDAPIGGSPDAHPDARFDAKPPPDAMVDAIPPPDAQPLVTGLVINELDYDTINVDQNEFVELYNGSGTTIDLTAYCLVLVNGATNLQYLRIPLTGSVAPGAYWVVSDPTEAVIATVDQVFSMDNIIQNGAPDAVGLFYVPSGTPVDLVSYEGPVTAGVTDFGTFSFPDVLPGALDSNVMQQSFDRIPDGTSTWVLSNTPSPRTTNKP